MNTPKRFGRIALLILICLANLPSVVISARTARAAVREFAEMEISGEGIGSGTLRFELWPEVAPRTVANFRYLAESGFYDDTAFDRLIPGSMVQGGDPLTRRSKNPRNLAPTYPPNDGSGGPGYFIPDEIRNDPRYAHTRGVLSMVNSTKVEEGIANTGGSRFFIMLGEDPSLNSSHSSFGRMTAESDAFLSRIEGLRNAIDPKTGNTTSVPSTRVSLNRVRISRLFTGVDKPRIIPASYGGRLENPFYKTYIGSTFEIFPTSSNFGTYLSYFLKRE